MPHGSIHAVLPTSCRHAFDLLHDYERRLEWDTLLQEAYLVDAAAAAQGVESVCRGRWYLGGLALRTRYVTFRPPCVAAVKLVAPVPCFASFAAELPLGRSSLEYRYNFSAHPRALRWLLEPLMARVFAWETAKRLRALGRFLERDRRNIQRLSRS